MKNKKIYIPIIIIAIAIIFFSYAPVITFDTSHYLWLVNMLSPNAAFADWDIARGLVFPLMIYASTIIFGAGSDGILVTMFIMYITMISFVYLTLKKAIKDFKVFENVRNRIILGVLVSILIIFNPIVFGYYHVLLTEFVGMTLAVVMTYLSWDWIDFDFKDNKKKYIIYTLVFSILTAFAWSLKQPYVSCVMFPILVASLIAIIRKFNVKQVIQRIVTIIVCIIMLIISIVIWNKILEFGHVSMQEDRTSESFLSNGIIDGITQLEETGINNIKEIEISEKDQKEIENIANGTSKYKNYKLFKNKNENSKGMVLFSKEENPSTGESIKFWFKTLGTTPSTIIRSYINNYLCTINIFKITFTGPAPEVTTELNLFGAAENEAISYKIYRDLDSNVFPKLEGYEPFVEPYKSKQEPIKIVNVTMKALGRFSTMCAKVGFLILPIVLIWVIVVTIKNRKETNKHKLYDLLIVLLGFSYLHVLMHIVLGACIDRYTVPAIVPMYTSYIIIGYMIFENRKNKTKLPK